MSQWPNGPNGPVGPVGRVGPVAGAPVAEWPLGAGSRRPCGPEAGGPAPRARAAVRSGVAGPAGGVTPAGSRPRTRTPHPRYQAVQSRMIFPLRAVDASSKAASKSRCE
ncbi:hypothetical protein Slala05_30470 [Streptomyces lavendulae subsp. lavendulae]|nr:hypothetical protein Slala05_30470 [Streptomyces lavendulae subsp. lavendulae]